jgi:hypothetical protein
MGPISYVTNEMAEMVAGDKPSSLLGPFISYEENVVLLIES